MKTPAFLLLALSFFWAACGSNDKPAEEQPPAVTETRPVADSVLTPNFYKRLEGTIADQQVVVHLQCANGTISGLYYYLNHGIWLMLSGSLNTAEPNKVSLTESSLSDGEKVAVMECSYEQGAFKGSWRSADGSKSYLVDLKEAYPQGSYTFTALSFSDSLSVVNGPEAPVARISNTFVIPLKDDTDGKWLSQKIRKALNMNSSLYALDLPAAVKKMNGKYLKAYRDEMKQMSQEDAASAMMNYEEIQHVSVCYNDNGFVILNSDIYAYTGGAHGNGGSNFYCLDVQNKKELKLEDVLNADSARLQPIVEAAFRKQQGLGPADSLNTILFENYLATTENFYFTNKGIGFYYFPYEVAAYAVGPIQVFVPFTALKPLLKQGFAQRMKL